MSVEIVLPSDPDAAVALFARALRESFSGTREVSVRSDDAAAADRFLIAHEHAAFTVVLDPGSLSMRVEKRGAILGSVAYALAGHIAVPRSPRLRVLFAGGSSNDRRLRMTAKAIGEARQRNVPSEVVATGTLPAEWNRAVLPDHQFAELTPDEVLRLVRSSSCLLECGDDSEMPTALALIAAAVGTPVIVHRASVLATQRSEAVVAVEEWSADAFVEALTRPLRDVAPRQPDLAAEFLRIVESGRA